MSPLSAGRPPYARTSSAVPPRHLRCRSSSHGFLPSAATRGCGRAGGRQRVRLSSSEAPGKGRRRMAPNRRLRELLDEAGCDQAQLARWVNLGEEAACSTALGAAECELGRSEPECEPDWLRYFGPAELSAHAANCLRDLGHPAASLAHARDAYAGFPESAVRSRGFIRTGEAIALLDQRDVEAACVAASDALDIAGRVRSARSRELLSDFQTRLRSDAAVPVARELLDRIGRHPELRQREHGEAHSGENHGVARARAPLATADQQHAGRRTGAAQCREHADQPATADRPRRHRLNHGRQ